MCIGGAYLARGGDKEDYRGSDQGASPPSNSIVPAPNTLKRVAPRVSMRACRLLHEVKGAD
jgi:hypothetical protein